MTVVLFSRPLIVNVWKGQRTGSGFDLVDCKHSYITTTHDRIGKRQIAEENGCWSSPCQDWFEQQTLEAKEGRGTRHLSVGLSNTLKFVFLFDGVRVGRALGCVDQFVGKAFSDRLDVAEGRFTGLYG